MTDFEFKPFTLCVPDKSLNLCASQPPHWIAGTRNSGNDKQYQPQHVTRKWQPFLKNESQLMMSESSVTRTYS